MAASTHITLSRVRFGNEVEPVFRDMLLALEDRARDTAPVGKSHESAGRQHGVLRDSVRSRPTVVSALRYVGEVVADGHRPGNRQSHATWVHEGRRAISGTRMAIPFEDAVVVRWAVKASTPNPWMLRAAEEVFGAGRVRRR